MSVPLDQPVIEDLKLANKLQQIAEQEHRSIEDVLFSMVTQYRPQSMVDEMPDAEQIARLVRLAAYEQARAHWGQLGNTKRAEMTDEQLDEEFWLFDVDGFPRLKTDKGKVKLPEASLYRTGQVLLSVGFRSRQTDISARSREILDDEFTDYLLSRTDQPTDDTNSRAST